MKIVVGLGNPGKQYGNTRHNAGFLFLDKLASSPEVDASIFSFEEKFEAEVAAVNFKGEKLVLVKPHTFMNLSGRAVAKVMQYYKVELDDLIVISDDIDLPLGQARIRAEGSSGGQKGLKNILETLKTEKLLRIRLGIRTLASIEDENVLQNRIDTADFVLSKFTPREKPVFNEISEMTIKYLLLHLGQKHEVPAHTLEVQSHV
jgi:PTH1 family peptidyl-tRNA hydrolase